MGSKLWLCYELEKINLQEPATIWVLGGWHGLLAQLLFIRDKIKIEKIRSFDIDPQCEETADQLNNLWVWREWRFKAFTQDCNELDYARPELWASIVPNIVVNTAIEHFHTNNWWHKIPVGTLCVLQSNNLQHEEHVHNIQNESELAQMYPLSRQLFCGALDFDYKNKTSFKRFMTIGFK